MPATRIASGSSALLGLQALARNQRAMHQAMERLATGKRINRTSDDPAGAAVASSLDRRRVTLEEVIKQAEYGQHVLDAADGGLGQIEDLLVELNGLVVQSAQGGTRTDAQKQADQTQADSIVQSIDYLLNNTTFDRKHILTDAIGFEHGDTWMSIPNLAGITLGQVTITKNTPPPPHPGPPAPGQPPPVQPPPQTQTLDLHDLAGSGPLSLASGDHELAQQSVKSALDTVARVRAQIGSMGRFTLGAQTNVDQAELEGTTAAESSIVDADFAVEAANLVRAQTLTQASIAVIQMAQRNEQNALALLG